MTNEQIFQPAPTPQDPWKTARARFSRIGVALTVMVALWLLCGNLLGALVTVAWPTSHIPGWMTYVVSGVPLYALAMPVARLMLSTVPALPTRRFALGARRTLEFLAMCFPIIIGGNIIGTLLSAILSGGQASNRVADVATANGLLPNALYMVVLAPIFEEWIFRKQIIDRTRAYGERTAILLSALAFALFHLNLYQFFYAFGIGVLFAYVYMRTSMLRYSWLLHMLINLNGAVLAPLMLRLAGPLATDPAALAGMGEAELAERFGSAVMAIGAYGLVLIALCVAGIVLLAMRWRRREFYVTPLELPRGTAARTVLVTPGMLAYVVLAVVLSVAMTL